jgi:hypothetical protein
VDLEAEEADEKAEKEMRDNVGKKRKDGARDEIQIMTQAYKIGGESLVLLRVNRRSIYNKVFEFHNLVHSVILIFL